MTGVVIPRLELRLPEFERRRAAALAGGWRDLLYVPGPGFASPLDPGLYRSALVILPANGPVLRLTSLVVPAFGDTLCRLRLEPITLRRLDNLGSFFDPSRRGTVHAFAPDRRSGAAAPPPDRTDWSYRGASLEPRLGSVSRVRLLRERVTAGQGDGTAVWTADRGLALTGADGGVSLILAEPESSEQVAFAPAIGPWAALLAPAASRGTSPAAAVTPGATVKDLLGYGDWGEPFRIEVEIETLA